MEPATLERATLEYSFRSIDADGSGSLDAAEIGRALATLGQPADGAAVAALLAAADTDRSGALDMAEFVAAMQGGGGGGDALATGALRSGIGKLAGSWRSARKRVAQVAKARPAEAAGDAAAAAELAALLRSCAEAAGAIEAATQREAAAVAALQALGAPFAALQREAVDVAARLDAAQDALRSEFHHLGEVLAGDGCHRVEAHGAKAASQTPVGAAATMRRILVQRIGAGALEHFSPVTLASASAASDGATPQQPAAPAPAPGGGAPAAAGVSAALDSQRAALTGTRATAAPGCQSACRLLRLIIRAAFRHAGRAGAPDQRAQHRGVGGGAADPGAAARPPVHRQSRLGDQRNVTWDTARICLCI